MLKTSVFICVHLWLMLLTGCVGPRRAQTTFLNSVDLIAMTDRMADSFAHAPAIAQRTAQSDPWVISMYRVQNHTNQIIPDREKWLYLARLRASLAQSNISKERHLIWVIPPERWPMVAKELGVSTEPYGLRLDPTHLLTAEFYALTNSSGKGRSDSYFCDYQLVDVLGGTMVWEDKWEVKRAITGKTYD